MSLLYGRVSFFEHPLKMAHGDYCRVYPSVRRSRTIGENIEVTRKLVFAGSLIKIPDLDHLIIGRPSKEFSGFFQYCSIGIGGALE